MTSALVAAQGSRVLADNRNPACPYRPAHNLLCSASVMAVVVDNRKKSIHCDTEDFDRCPLFLAKVLRG
jgi:hypothetical protein